MKKQEKEILNEQYKSIFEGFKKVLNEHNLPDLSIGSVEFDALDDEQSNDEHEKAVFSAELISCPIGYKKSYKINPHTGKQTVICVPVV